MVFLLASIHIARSHPHYLSTYNLLVGGPSGAEKLGFETTYWLDAVTPDILQAVNREVPLHGKLQFDGIVEALYCQKDFKVLRRDIQIARGYEHDVKYRLMVHRQGFVDPREYEQAIPLYEIIFQGASLVKLVQVGPNGRVVGRATVKSNR